MPKGRLPRELWLACRVEVWERDKGRCVRCGTNVKLDACHIDHIQSGKQGTNHLWNLRTLCRRCHTLRADPRHRGMIANALRDGIHPSRLARASVGGLIWQGSVWFGWVWCVLARLGSVGLG
jgi:hypothetical protein